MLFCHSKEEPPPSCIHWEAGRSFASFLHLEKSRIPQVFPFFGSSFLLPCIPSMSFPPRPWQLCPPCTAPSTSTAASSPPSVSSGGSRGSPKNPQIPKSSLTPWLGQISRGIPTHEAIEDPNPSHFSLPQTERVDRPSTGPTTKGLNIPSPSSCGIRGSTDSCCPPDRSFPPPRRPGWR